MIDWWRLMWWDIESIIEMGPNLELHVNFWDSPKLRTTFSIVIEGVGLNITETSSFSPQDMLIPISYLIFLLYLFHHLNVQFHNNCAFLAVRNWSFADDLLDILRYPHHRNICQHTRALHFFVHIKGLFLYKCSSNLMHLGEIILAEDCLMTKLIEWGVLRKNIYCVNEAIIMSNINILTFPIWLRAPTPVAVFKTTFQPHLL